MADHTGLFRFDNDMADAGGLPLPALSFQDVLAHAGDTSGDIASLNDRYGQAVSLFVADFGDVLKAGKDMKLEEGDVAVLVAACVEAFNAKE